MPARAGRMEPDTVSSSPAKRTVPETEQVIELELGGGHASGGSGKDSPQFGEPSVDNRNVQKSWPSGHRCQVLSSLQSSLIKGILSISTP